MNLGHTRVLMQLWIFNLYVPAPDHSSKCSSWLGSLCACNQVSVFPLTFFIQLHGEQTVKIPPGLSGFLVAQGASQKKPICSPFSSFSACDGRVEVSLTVHFSNFVPSSARTICLRALEEKQTYLIEHNRSPDERG